MAGGLLTPKQRKELNQRVKFTVKNVYRMDKERRERLRGIETHLEKWRITLEKKAIELDKREEELEQKAGFIRIGEAQKVILEETIKMGQQIAKSAVHSSHVLRHKGVTMVMTPFGPMPVCGPF